MILATPHASDVMRETLGARTEQDREYFKDIASAFTVAELLQFIGKPITVPAEGAADYLAEEVIRMYEANK